MGSKNNSGKEKRSMRCQRCNGRMAFEKFYGEHDYYFGWHCLTCGEILDPVILLHRLSHDPGISIPEKKEEIIPLLNQYVTKLLRN